MMVDGVYQHIEGAMRRVLACDDSSSLQQLGETIARLVEVTARLEAN